MVLQGVFEGFADVTKQFGKPIINEVIGVDHVEDAKRAGDDILNKGVEAVFATTELLHWV